MFTQFTDLEVQKCGAGFCSAQVKLALCDKLAMSQLGGCHHGGSAREQEIIC
jgi:hypothetical protein